MITGDTGVNATMKTRLDWMVDEAPYLPRTYVHQTLAAISKMTITKLPEGKWGAAIYREGKFHAKFETDLLQTALDICEGYSMGVSPKAIPQPEKPAVATKPPLKTKTKPKKRKAAKAKPKPTLGKPTTVVGTTAVRVGQNEFIKFPN